MHTSSLIEAYAVMLSAHATGNRVEARRSARTLWTVREDQLVPWEGTVVKMKEHPTHEEAREDAEHEAWMVR